MAKTWTRRILWQLLAFFGYGILSLVLAALVGLILVAESSRDLELWHTAELDMEFTRNSRVQSFEQYLSLEEKLFAERDREVSAKLPPSSSSDVNRFTKGSLASPSRFSRDWNRTFEFKGKKGSPGVVLVHGMSDSPYSFRNLGLALNRAGAHTIGLRLPGHGTAPVGLTTATWQDMAAALTLAISHAQERAGKGPVYLVGYSNGGALSLEYALRAAQSDKLKQVNGVVLISPAVGITRMAALAVWQQRIGALLGLDKLAWNTVLPEYDPFKYQSFAVNAGNQTYRLTLRISELLSSLERSESVNKLPPILAFQSAVDATVSTEAVLESLLNRLPANGHEFVVFDINRDMASRHLIADDPHEALKNLLQASESRYAVSVVSNSETSHSMEVRRRTPDAPGTTVHRLTTAWPSDVYSLSHVALPFPRTDPLYGDAMGGDPYGEEPKSLRLGAGAMRGERGVLLIPAGDMLRQRWNPFYEYLENRTLQFMGLPSNAASPAP